MKTRIGVIVRQRHIDRGRCRSPKSCPIALAMKEQLGTDKVKVYADGVFVDEQKYWIPFRARRFIYDFDTGFPVDPLAFLMDAVPEQSPPENAPPKAVAERRNEICLQGSRIS